jgi:hypothetical protein
MLNRVCDEHGHEDVDELPDRELRGHVLAKALRAADAVLSAHGFDASRSLEVLHIGMFDVGEDVDELERSNKGHADSRPPRADPRKRPSSANGRPSRG